MKITLSGVLGLIAVASLSGCSLSPSLPFLGAAFPDWLYCFVGGGAVTWLLFIFFGPQLKKRFEINMAGVIVVAAIFAMSFWLLLFS